MNPLSVIKRFLPVPLVCALPGRGAVYLTFDDGPTPDNTEWIIETLARYDAKATFFCLGKNAEQHPETFSKILAAGHAVGNHTYSHQRGWNMSTRRYVDDVDFAAQFIHSDLFRPPYARIKPAQARVLAERYDLIMWSVLSRDHSPLVTPRQCTRRVIGYLREGAIVVFHDSWKSSRRMRYALPRVLDYIYNNMQLRCEALE